MSYPHDSQLQHGHHDRVAALVTRKECKVRHKNAAVLDVSNGRKIGYVQQTSHDSTSHPDEHPTATRERKARTVGRRLVYVQQTSHKTSLAAPTEKQPFDKQPCQSLPQSASQPLQPRRRHPQATSRYWHRARGCSQQRGHQSPALKVSHSTRVQKRASNSRVTT